MENKDIFLQNIRDAIPQLLELANKVCYNKISSNLLYITTEIDHTIQNSDDIKYYVKINALKKPKAELEDILNVLGELYLDLYDVNFYIYKSLRNSTIIDIRYLLKSSFDKEYYQKIQDRSPMLHTKIDMPPYSHEFSHHSYKKININWQHNTLDHKWKMFIWRLKFRNFK